MRFSMAMIAVLTVGALVYCFIAPAAWAQPDFLHIDCGVRQAYTDIVGVLWETDDAYISTGELGQTKDQTQWSTWQELANNRFFRNSRAKNCYTLPVTPGQTYLLRAEFMFGEYDSSLPYPSFQLAIDSSVVDNVTINSPYDDVIKEFTIAATRNVTSFCLVQDATNTTPFVNSISLRAVRNLPRTILTHLAQNQSVSTMARIFYNQTATIIWYVQGDEQESSDLYDRYWFGSSNVGKFNSFYPMRDVGRFVTSTAALEFLAVNTTSTVDTNASSLVSEPKYVNELPQPVFRGLMTTAGNLTIPLNFTTAFTAYIQCYFVELDPSVNATDRSFFMDWPGAAQPDLLNIFKYAGGASRAWAVPLNNDTLIDANFKISMYPDPARTSLKGPMLSGLEVFKVDTPWVAPTNGRDYGAIEEIKTNMQLTSWGGDPCRPYPHEWLTCNQFDGKTTEAEVTAALLSGYNLTGAISPAFNRLLSLRTLVLDNNSLTGPIPDLRALKNLKTLHVQNNNLTGPLPNWLASLPLEELFVQNNRFSGEVPSEFLNKKWNFNYSGNPSMQAGSPSPSKKSGNIGAIIGGVIGALVALGASIGLIVFCRRRGGGGEKDLKDHVLPSSHGKNAKLEGAREYSLAEVDAATEYYKKVIGKGGFGPVYYGRLRDGREVAVKALDKASRQGQGEFSNEVAILSRVHHKYLVSLVGYCGAEGKQMLIYEYIHKGSLRDHLDGNVGSKTGSSEVLDWKTRLEIGLQAALGLEYLHTGCSPSLIHRDVKSSNILITSGNKAKVSDFGISRLVGEGDSREVMTSVKGTAGYLDPEYYQTQLLSAKSDVYGFGVVLLELITGRLPIHLSDPNEPNPNICDWVRSNLLQGNIDAILDPKLRASCPSHDALWKVAEIAMQSVEPKSVHRLTMSEVVQGLHGAVELESASKQPPPPPAPRFRTSSSPHASGSNSPNSSQFGPYTASYPTTYHSPR